MRSLLLLCVFSLTVGASAQTLHRLDGTTLTAQQARSIADRELTADHVTGAQIALLHNGRMVWTYAYGLRDIQQHLPMTTDTYTWAASITKSVFATWVMKLVEEHRLNLDTPIAQLMPQGISGYFHDTSLLTADPRYAKLTPRILLSHTSGLPNFAPADFPDGKLRIQFDPGIRYAYSGEGLTLLQYVIEQAVTHEPLETSMQRDLFTPLGMNTTSLTYNQRFGPNSAARYGATGNFLNYTRRNPARASGSMATSVNDLSRFLEALWAGRILRPPTRKQMFSPQIRINFAHQFPTNDRTTSSEGPRVGLAYGLGWGLLTRTKFGPAVFKEGHGDGAENFMICFTRHNDCMVILTNSDNGELAFRPLLEQLLGDTVTPWVWEGYTREQLLANSEHQSR
ncbi:MAG TPA: serine hydrolase domain-containing protein [Acidobacteriaceae bacterium]|jgi:CubicO group peptidase (beta-lactamase class C family)|nr:serine hydrolase domain-containing protein [Acidobacteriaceae bacterium]